MAGYTYFMEKLVSPVQNFSPLCHFLVRCQKHRKFDKREGRRRATEEGKNKGNANKLRSMHVHYMNNPKGMHLCVWYICIEWSMLRKV